MSEEMQKQMEEMTLQRHRVRVFLKKVHSELQKLNTSDFGLLEDRYYDAPERPTPNYVDGLRLTKSKKELKVKGSVDTMLRMLVQVNREVVDAQKATYRHAIAKRRLATVSAGRHEELGERQRERQAKHQRKEKLATVERPSVTELSAAVSDDEDPFEDVDLT
jgi:hypothetical protein